MVVIPEGSFLMGCEQGANNERPAHRVWVDGFALSQTAITNHQYHYFLAATSRESPPGFSDIRFNQPGQPVTSVSWLDATAYCLWLSRQTGKAYRLPTEAEWERAARGGVPGNRYTWGNDPPANQPRYFELWSSGPEPVGQRPPNAFGLYDMSENVHEWCADWFDEKYYRDSPERNPQGPSYGTRRSSRGGSWRHQIKITRVAARSSLPPEFRYSDYGFRCAMSME
jgi:formylglycine-generating enzyme